MKIQWLSLISTPTLSVVTDDGRVNIVSGGQRRGDNHDRTSA
jgi:hypothetical protein